MTTNPIQELIFIDIETVSQNSDYEENTEDLKKIWQKKMRVWKDNLYFRRNVESKRRSL